MEETKTELNDIILILDESGSMIDNKKEVIESVNSFVKEQQTLNKPNSFFSLFKFNNKVNLVYDNIPLNEVPEFTSENYKPYNMTSLHDAIGTAITKNKTKSNIICVILTDGEENSSKDFDPNTIKNLISEMKDKNKWEFIYLAANQDAFFVGSNIGIRNCVNFDASPQGILTMERCISTTVRRYRSGESNPDDIIEYVSNTTSTEDHKDDPMLIKPPLLVRTKNF